MENFSKQKENVEYFYRHFNDNNTSNRKKVVGTICMAVHKGTNRAVAAGAATGHGDQFSKKIGREIARGRVNKFLSGQKVDAAETGLVKELGTIPSDQDPTNWLFDIKLGRENGYIAVTDAE